MILAAHQPQYLPWLGYFHKMARCDVFVYLDDVQYKKREFQNRNRIRTKDGWQWLTVPVMTKGNYTQDIRDVVLEPGSEWTHDHWLALQLAYAKAAHFQSVAPGLEAFYKRPWTKLGEMCEAQIDFHRRQFGIDTPLRRSSELGITTMKSQRLVDLCKALGADVYLSGQGARDYLDGDLFARAGIKVVFQEFRHPEYAQAYRGFQSHLAAVDLLFNHGPASRGILLATN